eukprot:m.158323 g.158323  ORF g.158323 m.158323 type:complete len:142 (-) comp31084_c0_seq1:505-930(-)
MEQRRQSNSIKDDGESHLAALAMGPAMVGFSALQYAMKKPGKVPLLLSIVSSAVYTTAGYVFTTGDVEGGSRLAIAGAGVGVVAAGIKVTEAGLSTQVLKAKLGPIGFVVANIFTGIHYAAKLHSIPPTQPPKTNTSKDFE